MQKKQQENDQKSGLKCPKRALPVRATHDARAVGLGALGVALGRAAPFAPAALGAVPFHRPLAPSIRAMLHGDPQRHPPTFLCHGPECAELGPITNATTDLDVGAPERDRIAEPTADTD